MCSQLGQVEAEEELLFAEKSLHIREMCAMMKVESDGQGRREGAPASVLCRRLRCVALDYNLGFKRASLPSVRAAGPRAAHGERDAVVRGRRD